MPPGTPLPGGISTSGDRPLLPTPRQGNHPPSDGQTGEPGQDAEGHRGTRLEDPADWPSSYPLAGRGPGRRSDGRDREVPDSIQRHGPMWGLRATALYRPGEERGYLPKMSTALERCFLLLLFLPFLPFLPANPALPLGHKARPVPPAACRPPERSSASLSSMGPRPSPKGLGHCAIA